jgi:hypothetical protein
VQERSGKLFDRHSVVREIEKLHRICRDRRLNIPSRVTTQVAALTEISDIQDVLSDEIRAALDELCDALEQIARGNPQ